MSLHLEKQIENARLHQELAARIGRIGQCKNTGLAYFTGGSYKDSLWIMIFVHVVHDYKHRGHHTGYRPNSCRA